MKRNIVLMGFMGVGKTSVGRELALRLKREFVDLDELLEAKLGVSITEFLPQKVKQPFANWRKKRSAAWLKNVDLFWPPEEGLCSTQRMSGPCGKRVS